MASGMRSIAGVVVVPVTHICRKDWRLSPAPILFSLLRRLEQWASTFAFGDPQPEASMEIRPIWAVGIEEQNLNVAVLETR